MNRVRSSLSIILVIFVALAAAAAGTNDCFTVILDPGHGGKDYGAVGKLTNEKTINLNVGLEVKRLLADRKGINVVMTRDDDRFITLQERANIANRNHGDLFVSIHVNSVAKSNKNRLNIAGASVYTLGLHRTASNFEVAKRENSVMELEADYTTRYQGFDPNSTESYIMFELSQNKHLDRSISFADMTVSQLCSNAGRRNRGVLQAGFWVLHASAMPAVLVELDFICNPTSEKFLNSKDGVAKMGRAIANAIIQYAGLGTELPPAVTAESDPAPAAEEKADSTVAAVPVVDPCPEGNIPDGPSTADGKITYRVQFMAAAKSLPANSAEFKGLTGVEEYVQGGLHKYTAGGDFATEGAAERYAASTVRQKFPQAFIIKWQNGKRIN